MSHRCCVPEVNVKKNLTRVFFSDQKSVAKQADSIGTRLDTRKVFHCQHYAFPTSLCIFKHQNTTNLLADLGILLKIPIVVTNAVPNLFLDWPTHYSKPEIF